ncbi:hypothetical protein GCM10025868_00690 [Angustibacter aerolatus]|uniref:NADP-dependent oxidoreductase domain-containing protein n=1 Tax=Angustibacter aerolatus TaxID=1162965 RepID=A0ABQ6JBJ6_9ACTN|nr:hypothetical protein GCM10025868_00690 [Angustibacter aerolatus]
MLASLDASLARLGTDHVDLWLAHTWSDDVPLAETLDALVTAVRTGRARYAGISNYAGWQAARVATLAEAQGAGLIVANQVEYSLLSRGVEDDVVPAALGLGLGLMAWSPLGRGVLTGKYRTGTPADSRAASPHFATFVERYLDEDSRRVVEAVVAAADGLGCSPAEIALAWVRDQPGVVAPVVGARTAAPCAARSPARTSSLPEQIRAALDEVSVGLR